MSEKSTDEEAVTYAATKEEIEKLLKKDEINMSSNAPIFPSGNRLFDFWSHLSFRNPETMSVYKLNKSIGTVTGLSKSMKNKRVGDLNYFTGMQGWENSINGIDVLVRWFNITSGKAGYIQYLFGYQGSGKTDWATLQGEYLHKIKGVEVGTNIKSLAENVDHIKFIDTYVELEKWLREGGRKYYILDEASSLLSGYYTDAMQVVKHFQSLVTKLRKNESNIVLIGHSGKDIHPLFRRLAVFVQKEYDETEDTHKIHMYRSAKVDSNGQVDGISHLLSFRDIPPTSYKFSTKEESSFKMTDKKDIEEKHEYTKEELEEAIQKTLDEELREQRNTFISKIYDTTDLSMREVAKKFDVSKSTVENITNN